MSTETVAPYAPGPDVPGWLSWYDVVVPMESGGKDSQTAMRHAVRALEAADMLDRTAALHIDLGERVEWPQVPELVAEQSARFGMPLADGPQWAGRLHYTRRAGGDLLDDVATRTKRDGSARGWPTMWTRYCTSDHKTAPGRAFVEALCARIREERGLDRPVRVLQVMGFRADESRARAARPVFEYKPRLSTRRRHVFEWLPIHHLTTAQVWDDIRESGVPYHPVYDQGMTRLSCRHCIMGSAADLAISKRLSPDTAAAYERVEAELGDSFQHNRPLASIPAQPGTRGFAVHWLACPTCGVRVLAESGETVRHCPAHAATGPWAGGAVQNDAPSCVQLPLFVSSWRETLGDAR